MKKTILISGPKHSGKTLASRALQKITGWEAADLDELIEKQTGKSPRMLFREGSEIFQTAEARALASLIGQNNPDERMKPDVPHGHQEFLIIAAGGGLVDNSEALELLSPNKETIIVYLDLSAETAWRRIRCPAGRQKGPWGSAPFAPAAARQVHPAAPADPCPPNRL